METHIRLGVSGREIGGSGVVHELSCLQGLVVESWAAFRLFLGVRPGHEH